MKERYLGLDYGLARIGLSLSDESLMIASPIALLLSKKKLEDCCFDLVKRVKEIEKERLCRISTIVIGIPYYMNKSEGLMADEVRKLAELLKEALKETLIVIWDERLTTVQAERMLMQSGMNRKKRSKVIDSVAATIILQNYLDFKRIRNVSTSMD